MILLSVDIATGRAAMVGFPRNLTNVPIEDPSGNGQFNRMWTDPFPPGNGDPSQSLITNMWQFAKDNPSKFFTPTDACQPNDPNLNECLGNARGYRALSGAIQNLSGVPIQGVISVNLTAFRDLVDAVGGIWMNIPDPVYDDAYPVGAGDTQSPHVIDIPAGCHWLNGVYALAYARSRHQDSDYQRMRRQQSVLQAVRRQFNPMDLLTRLDQLLGVASTNLWTTISRDQIPLLAQIAARVNADSIYNVRITPGQGYPSQLSDAEITSIRSRVQHVFDQAQPAPEPTPADPKDRCPAPGMTPGETYNTTPHN
jgi:LCP family protein required for cell wall assembly